MQLVALATDPGGRPFRVDMAPLPSQEWLESWTEVQGVEGLVIKGRSQRYLPGARGWFEVRRREATATSVVIGQSVHGGVSSYSANKPREPDVSCQRLTLALHDGFRISRSPRAETAGVLVQASGAWGTPTVVEAPTLRAVQPGNQAPLHPDSRAGPSPSSPSTE